MYARQRVRHKVQSVSFHVFYISPWSLTVECFSEQEFSGCSWWRENIWYILAERLFLLPWVGYKKVHSWEWIQNPKGSVISNLGRAWRVGGECGRKWEKHRWRQYWAKLMTWDLVPWKWEPVKTFRAAPTWQMQKDILCQSNLVPVWSVPRELLLFLVYFHV